MLFKLNDEVFSFLRFFDLRHIVDSNCLVIFNGLLGRPDHAQQVREEDPPEQAVPARLVVLLALELILLHRYYYQKILNEIGKRHSDFKIKEIL